MKWIASSARGSLCVATLASMTFAVAPLPAQALSVGCPLSLPANVGGVCEYINDLLSRQALQMRFAGGSKSAAFGVDASGNAYIKAVVAHLSSDGKVNDGWATYRFKVQDVEFRPKGGDEIGIDCKVGECMEASGTKIIGTGLLILDKNEWTKVHEAFQELKQSFCPKSGSC